MIAFGCPWCGDQHRVPDNQGGTTTNCSGCGKAIRVPTKRSKAAPGAQGSSKPTGPTSGAAGVEVWYHMHRGKQYGPVTFEFLQGLFQTGKVSAEELVWSTMTNTWKPAREVAGLIGTPTVESSGVSRDSEINLKQRARKYLVVIGGVAGLAFVVLSCILVARLLRTPSKPDDGNARGDGGKGAGKNLRTEEIVARSEKAVALIDTPLGHGTGFLVGTNLLVTNAHVIELATVPHIKVFFPSTETGKKAHLIERVLHFDKKRDLAILEVKTAIAPLPLASRDKISRGQSATVIGNPGLGRGLLKLENAVSNGIVSSETKLPHGTLLQLNISINPGNSGGPVFSSFGEVIGVIQSKAITEEAIAFAIPVADVSEARDKVEKTPSEQKDQLTSQFNARVVLVRAVKAAKLFNWGTEVMQRRWLEMNKQFGSAVQSDFDLPRKNYRDLLAKKNLAHFLELRDIEEAIAKVGTDSRLSETTRQRLADLWKTCQSFRLDFEAPLGTVGEYSARCNRNQVQMEELYGSLSVILGVEFYELDFAPP